MKHIPTFEQFVNEYQSFVTESAMGDVHIMAQEAGSFDKFKADFIKEFGKPKSVKELQQLEAWLQTIWKENK